MSKTLLLRYMQPLLSGRRTECFQLINEAVRHGLEPRVLATDVVWPAMSQIDRMYRDDLISKAAENMASRINRTIADQIQPLLPRKARNGKRVIVSCAPCENQETGAQMVADLLEAEGWEVFFLGGGVPHDEILQLIGQLRPYALLVFGTLPEAVPDTRRLVEYIREVNVCPTMNILVSGGVFNRAEGLWQEVGADVFAPTAQELLLQMDALRPREAGTRRIGVVKKRQRKRKNATPPGAALASA